MEEILALSASPAGSDLHHDLQQELYDDAPLSVLSMAYCTDAFFG